ncbi:MAG: extracellular solute-binding protein, partial [Methylocystis sp.]|nr:extracellular solute-binding protein [Methylocystis sp.]
MNRRDLLLGAGALAGTHSILGSQASAQTPLRFLTPETDPSQVRVWQAFVEQYATANRGVSIRPEYASWDDLVRKVSADLMAGSPPEVIAGSSREGFMATAARRNLLVDLTPVVEEIGRADFHAP